MSNFPHSTGNAFSLSVSPYAVQTNLETLITKARTNPHRRPSVPECDLESPINLSAPTAYPQPEETSESFKARRRSEYQRSAVIDTIHETSFDDGVAILLGDENEAEDDDEDARDLTERASSQSRRGMSRADNARRRRSHGSTASAPVGQGRAHGRRKSTGTRAPGTSRSRSKARTPPRKEPFLERYMKMTDSKSAGEDDEGDEEVAEQTSRGRDAESRPLSRVSTRFSETTSLLRHGRGSIHTRFADDASDGEGEDVKRGLLSSGGGTILGRNGLDGQTREGGLGLDFDPVEELDAQDLQLPVAEDGKEIRVWTEALKIEVPLLLRTSIPVFLTQLAEWSLVLASVVSIGHLGTAELAASSLASMTASVSSFSIMQGLATALDTLLPAAWTSSEPSRVGLWTQRQGVVMAVSMIPMFVLWWNVEGVLRMLGQEAEVAALASRYLRWLSMGIPGYGGNVVVKKYLQAQNLMNIPTYVLFIAAPANIALNFLLVWGPKPVRMGFVGGAIATALSYNLTFVLSLSWVMLYGPREAFHPLRLSHLFSKLGTVTSLGLAGTIMLSSEWWAWEACALAASLLGPTALAAQSVLLSTASTFYQVPASLGIASAVRCGNLLGAGRGWEAKWASRASLGLSVVFALLNSAILVIFKSSWGYLFNSDPEVVALVAQVLPYIALFQLTDGLTATAGAILRSLGLHTTGALINLTCYYVIGLPFGLWLTFSPSANLGLTGLWIGLSIALGYATVVSAVLVWRADWVRAVERVRERLGLEVRGEVRENGKWEDEVDGDEVVGNEEGETARVINGSVRDYGTIQD